MKKYNKYKLKTNYIFDTIEIIFRQINFFHLYHFAKNRHQVSIQLFIMDTLHRIFQKFIITLLKTTQIVLF